MYENALAIKIPPADKILPGYFRTKKLRNLNQKISDRILYYVIVDTGYAIVLAKILFFVIFASDVGSPLVLSYSTPSDLSFIHRSFHIKLSLLRHI